MVRPATMSFGASADHFIGGKDGSVEPGHCKSLVITSR